MSRIMTKDEFEGWLAHPGTQHLMQILHKRREQRRQSWEGGSYTDYTREATALVNVGNLGECKGMAFVTDLDYETYEAEMSDE